MSLGRRALLQVAAATAALGRAAPAFGAAARADAGRPAALQGDRAGDAAQLHRPACPAHAALFPRAVGQSRRRRRRGLPPHLVGEKLLEAYKLGRGSVEAYALACTDFEGLARTYGRIGGLDRMATLIKAIRAERGDKVLLLDGGDTWQGSYTALQSKGADMVRLHERAQARCHDRRTGSSPTAPSGSRSWSRS